MDARQLHDEAIVVDTHNDLILLVDHFDRREQPRHFGDYWIPQLRSGGVDVQVLPVWVEDQFQTEGALRRTMILIERIHELAAEHADDVVLCLTAADIDAATTAGKIALVIALEGAHAIGQDPQLIRTLARVGVRVASIAHFGRTFLADGSGLDDSSRGRLTPEGVAVLQEMERLGVVFDISHLGVGGVDDVLTLATRPVLATHSACRAITDVHRNLTDDQLRGIAKTGGVISVAAAAPQYIDPENPGTDRIVDHIERIIDLTSVDHIGLGPDLIDDYFNAVWGGWPYHLGAPTAAAHGHAAQFVPSPILRPADLPKITETMVQRGYNDDDIKKILGGNVMRLFRQVLGRPAS